jgi:uncharacterized protein YeaO (DUF488 family)
MAIRVVQLGTRRHRGEGLRIGTVRHLPRGVRKERYAVDDWFDVWLPNLAPTAALVRLAKAHVLDETGWNRFAVRYRAEMKRPEASRVLDLVAALSHVTNLSVGCYCENARVCHRSVLLELLRERGAIVVTSSGRRA